MPSWFDKLFADLFASKLPSWTPEYEPQQYIVTTTGNGTQIQVPIAIDYCVTAATAEHLRVMYAPGGTVFEHAFEGAGGNNTSTAVLRDIVWPNKVAIGAGFLAGIWTRNAAHPDTADSLCRAAIAARGAV